MSQPPDILARRVNLLGSTTLVCLIILCLAWELWLAPLRPGGSLLVLKTVPLLAPLFGIIHGKRYTHQWASLLILLYVIEGIVRAASDVGASVPLAWMEILLSVAFFFAAVGYARLTRPSRTTGQEITTVDSVAHSPDGGDSVR